MGLWEYIRAHDSMIDEVRGNSYFSDPIAFEMDDGDIREVHSPLYHGPDRGCGAVLPAVSMPSGRAGRGFRI